MVDQPPLPASGSYLRSIRETSKALSEQSGILITTEAVERLLTSPSFTSSFKRVSAKHGLAMPLNFPSPVAELNLISILSLLNFASGFRVPLHTEIKRGAWDAIRAFVFTLYLTSTTGDDDFMSAQGIRAIKEGTVAELLGVNIHVERAHPDIPGLVIGEVGGPLFDLVKLITTVLNETGEILVESGFPDLGTFVAEALNEGANALSSGVASADIEVVLERLVRAFPGFRDMAIINDQPVYCFKKALFLIHAIHVRFGAATKTAPFAIPVTSQIPVFTDNVLPSLLIHLGVINLSKSPSLSHLFPDAASSSSLDSLLADLPADGPDSASNARDGPPIEGPILTVSESYMLRAAAIHACELLVEKGNGFTLPEMDMWLWSVAKDRPDYRKLPRFVLRETVFF